MPATRSENSTGQPPHDDFEFEHAPGLPGPLPAGEKLLWQGSPEWRRLALKPFRAHYAAIWFVGLALWKVGSTVIDGRPLADEARGILITLGLGAVAVTILLLLAWFTARGTIYSITSARVLIRYGIALQVTMNLPFTRVASAALALEDEAGDRGDIVLEPVAEERVSWAVLWPHVAPKHVARPRPSLRALADARSAAKLLGAAVADAGIGRPGGGHAAGAPFSAGTTPARAGGSAAVAARRPLGTAPVAPLGVGL